MNPNTNREKHLTRWLLAAVIVLLAAVLGLQLWQMFGSAPQSPPLAQTAHTEPETPEPKAAEPSAAPAAPELSPAPPEDLEAVLTQDSVPAASNAPTAPAAPSSGGEMIGETRAQSAALADAGLQESGTVYCNAWLEYDDGRPEHYEVEFATGERRYEYEIGLYDGAVLKREEKALSAAGDSAGTLIGEAAAKAAAFSHAGVREADAERVSCKLDWEDGRQVYEVEFHIGRLEYEYEIGAAGGEVLKAETDR